MQHQKGMQHDHLEAPVERVGHAVPQEEIRRARLRHDRNIGLVRDLARDLRVGDGPAFSREMLLEPHEVLTASVTPGFGFGVLHQ